MSTLPVRAEPAADEADPAPTFWNRPFVQNALPLMMSFGVHLAILAIGLLTWRAVVAIKDFQSAPPPVLPGDVDIDPTALQTPQFGGGGPDARNMRDDHPEIPADAAG